MTTTLAGGADKDRRRVLNALPIVRSAEANKLEIATRKLPRP